MRRTRWCARLCLTRHRLRRCGGGGGGAGADEAARGRMWRGRQPAGLTATERVAVITVSVVGGVLVLLLSGVFLYYKYAEMKRYFTRRKYEESLRMKRQSKFQPLPA